MNPTNAELLSAAITAGLGIQNASPNDTFLEDFKFYSALCPEVTFSGISQSRQEEVKLQSSSSNPSGNFINPSSGSSDYVILKVRTLTGTCILVEINLSDNVSKLKQKVFEQLQIPIERQDLVYSGRHLENANTIGSYGIANQSPIHLAIRLSSPEVFLSQNLFDPGYDYDFTSINDGNNHPRRGGYIYYRPCGWRRFALKAAGKYENDVWLNSSGGRPEWAVTYHGTDSEKLQELLNKKKAENRNLESQIVRGFYSTFHIETAMQFGKTFTFQNNTYMVIFQSRENIDSGKARVIDGEYVYSETFDYMRPYSICIKRV
ncbi:hypothetical protein SteCoe_35032 [Stentor coeruleus]|uniref:Ubiquitin-like domain-containing protein n=1 Tax=Stentor coeruleus TaxID=5963 RepID=A0A1R2AT84_9CILI|nr:hypothetical protein SteCoe_35032 [Stentor coeruleus]